jgi:hypothetical protein
LPTYTSLATFSALPDSSPKQSESKLILLTFFGKEIKRFKTLNEPGLHKCVVIFPVEVFAIYLQIENLISFSHLNKLLPG